MFQQKVILFIASLLVMNITVQAQTPKKNQFWWPNLIDVSPLRQHAAESNPLGENFDYAKEFKTLDLKALKADIVTLMKTSQDWWPADYGHYGPFFIRMAWHSTGTYRTLDGRGGAGGGQQRFEPLNSWPDNVNLDKARRLLWPIKKKYGNKISWADLMVLTGDVALESMGFKTLGFAGGRTDDWEPDLVYWGPEKKMLGSARHTRGRKSLKKPLAAKRMGLIYVNPEGPNGNHKPLDSARDIRETFGRMGMDDEETVALIAGGHAFGKAHGARRGKCNGAAPGGAGLKHQGMGWKSKCGSGKGADTVSSGLEGAWTATPAKWSVGFLANLFAFKWVQTKSPAGGVQWKPAKNQASKMVPDAHIKGKRHAPMMLTSDLALKRDPIYKKISQSFLKDPKKFEMAFARAWFKLTHRDLGPQARYLGDMAPKQTFKWQDPIPKVKHSLIGKGAANKLKKRIIKSGLTVGELVRTAWASASSFRSTDMRGGANGARLLLEPQKNWKINNAQEISKVTTELEKIRSKFNKSFWGGAKVSMADMIVLGGAAGIEHAAKLAGHKVKVPFAPGRADVTQEQTDINSFSVLESHADGFINYYSNKSLMTPIKMMIDKANLLGLSVPEMTVLVGGLRVIGANYGGTQHGVFTSKPGTLDNSFFVNLYDMSTKWSKAKTKALYQGFDRKSGELKWTASPVDLMFGSSSELRAVGEIYASDDGQQKFLNDFVKAWAKVMQADRFDLR